MARFWRWFRFGNRDGESLFRHERARAALDRLTQQPTNDQDREVTQWGTTDARRNG
jgi:hypothetical protein